MIDAVGRPNEDPPLVAVVRRSAVLVQEGALVPARLAAPALTPLQRLAGREIGRSFGARGSSPRADAPDRAEAPSRSRPHRPAPRRAGPPPPGTGSSPFLPEGSVVREIHADLPSMLIGGLTALFLQSLHPLAMAGVADHSRYDEDPMGRLRRTAEFVSVTTYGSEEQAGQAVDSVKRVHRHVWGRTPDGRPYSAEDPDLITWIHVAETWSFLQAVDRYGPRRLTRTTQDAYYADSARVALALGADRVPLGADETDRYLEDMRPQLRAGQQAMAARDFLVRGVARRTQDRAIYRAFVAAAAGILPSWARRELVLPDVAILDAAVTTPAARTLCAGVRWAVASISRATPTTAPAAPATPSARRTGPGARPAGETAVGA